MAGLRERVAALEISTANQYPLFCIVSCFDKTEAEVVAEIDAFERQHPGREIRVVRITPAPTREQLRGDSD